MLATAVLLLAGCPDTGGPATGAYSQWMGGPPFIGDLDGDGVEDLAGWFADAGVVALRGTDYEPLWSRADRRLARQDGRFVALVADGSVVLAQQRAVEILDGRTGATRATLEVTDAVGRLCSAGGKIGVHQIDQVSWTLDVAAGKRDDAIPPPTCDEQRPGLCDRVRHAKCEGSHDKPGARLTDPDTGDSVTIEIKSPGTPEIAIVGHDGSGKPTYRVAFDPSGARIRAVDLIAGTLVIRQTGTVALDAKTGARMWESTCGGSSGDAMVATPTRVYYECDGPKTAVALRIVDRATGGTLKDLGRPRSP